jgi:hypothetical protein
MRINKHGCVEASDHRCAGYDALSKVPPELIEIQPRDYIASLGREDSEAP